MDQTLEVRDSISPPTAFAVVPTSGVARRLRRLGAVVSLLRPHQWVKGLVVLVAPLVMAPVAAAGHAVALGLTLLSFLAASSGIYILNDLRDRELDRQHPTKRLRPIPSGAVRPGVAVAVLVVVAMVTAALLATVRPSVALVVVGYVVLNVWYCLALKHQPLVDVSVVAGGFVLRVLAGTLAAGLAVSPPLLISVYGAAVALALGKRRHELVRLSAEGGPAGQHRPTLATYSLPFLDLVVVVNLVAALVGYVAFMWLHSPPYGPIPAVLTFPFAAYAIFRYLQLLMIDESGGDPVLDLARDRPSLVNLGLWASVVVAALAVPA